MRRLYLALILLFAYSGHGYASCKRSEMKARSLSPRRRNLWWIATPIPQAKCCGNRAGFPPPKSQWMAVVAIIRSVLYEPGSAQSNASATINANDGNNTPVFSTGISGVGIAIKTQTNAGPYDNVMPIDNTYHNGDGNKTHHAMAPAYNVELVALGGPITSGTATFKVHWRAYLFAIAQRKTPAAMF